MTAAGGFKPKSPGGERKNCNCRHPAAPNYPVYDKNAVVVS
ncbi:hypothetical protein ABI_07600 [Asticcacaulis biprosthecium C19]|uniref:Uncharacterized protein n=1 Tax=Asticcacaulis biprosthecium C19 TaxID=715226 RepID=F4QLQ5_9CAUL|nr:hypothetical protein ABI_07600 [Asticcacaulis biprosthecium C19]